MFDIPNLIMNEIVDDALDSLKENNIENFVTRDEIKAVVVATRDFINADMLEHLKTRILGEKMPETVEEKMRATILASVAAEFSVILTQHLASMSARTLGANVMAIREREAA